MAITAGQRILASDVLQEHDANGRHKFVAWFPPLGGTGTVSSHGKYPSRLLDAGAETVLFSVRVPVWFVTLNTARVIIIPTGSGTFDWTANATSGAVGEDESNTTDTDTADGAGTTDDIKLAVDVSGALDGLALAPGDSFGLELILDVLGGACTELHVIGFELS